VNPVHSRTEVGRISRAQAVRQAAFVPGAPTACMIASLHADPCDSELREL